MTGKSWLSKSASAHLKLPKAAVCSVRMLIDVDLGVSSTLRGHRASRRVSHMRLLIDVGRVGCEQHFLRGVRGAVLALVVLQYNVSLAVSSTLRGH